MLAGKNNEEKIWNIWRIIKADARSLFTHFFALAVALVIADRKSTRLNSSHPK